MKQKISNLLICLILGSSLLAQKHPSAALQISSTTQGFMPPQMSESQRDAIAAPATGLFIYNLSTQKLDYYNGVAWERFTSTLDVEETTETVLSPTGKTWLAKNLGANQMATSTTDVATYGYLYQWGRNSDGHQFRTSTTASGPVASGSEGSNFITVNADPNDWLSTQDDSRWNGATKGTHDPCPSDFRVPT